jgi:hypothetical protein
VTSAELAVVAALGASLLTGLASLGVVAFQEWRRRKEADRDALLAAVTEMLSRSLAVSLRAQTMGLTMKVRSGLGEGVDVALRQRKPADPLELHDWIAQDLAPLNAAWSEIWARGDQEMVRLANGLLSACMGLMGVSTERQPADSVAARVRRWIVGERLTSEMQADIEKGHKELAHAREKLANYARHLLGQPTVALFGHVRVDDVNASQPARAATEDFTQCSPEPGAT